MMINSAPDQDFRVYDPRKNRMVHGSSGEKPSEGEIFVMWFTGLTDYHSTKIYAGDVIEMPIGLFYVTWLPAVAAYVMVPISKLGYDFKWFNEGNAIKGTQLMQGRVIGNVYQNKNLLSRQ